MYTDLLKMESSVLRYGKIVKPKAKVYGFFHYLVSLLLNNLKKIWYAYVVDPSVSFKNYVQK